MSGYTHCACRDCFDVVMSNTDEHALCPACEAAGCSPCIGAGCESCQRDDAYCRHDMAIDETVGNAENPGTVCRNNEIVTAYACTRCAYRAYTVRGMRGGYRYEGGHDMHPITAQYATEIGIVAK